MQTRKKERDPEKVLNPSFFPVGYIIPKELLLSIALVRLCSCTNL